MEITRLHPFPLIFTQDGLIADTDYIVTIMDDHATDLVELQATSDGDGVVSIDLPDYFSRYDDEYRVEVYLDLGTDVDGSYILGDLVLIDTLTIMRPYVDPTVFAESDSAEDIEQAKTYEAVARAIINSITGGFMYKREVVETTGLGSDYLPVPFRLNKIIKVYENGVLIYDAYPVDPEWVNIREYYIAPDKGAITVNLPTEYGINRRQSRPVGGRAAGSDSFTKYNTNDSPVYSEAVYDSKTFIDMTGSSVLFPNGWDYTVVVDAGWPVIPQDIKQAATLIMNDLKCNNIPYINSYIKDYKSDQFTLSFDPGVFKDTGNRIADKILSSYVRPIYRLGVL
jgi:hypothetical protein